MRPLPTQTSLPITVPSDDHLEFLRGVASGVPHGTAALLPTKGTATDFGLSSLGATGPAEFHMVVPDFTALGGMSLNLECSDGIWRIAGTPRAVLYGAGQGPRLLVGGLDDVSGALAPMLVATADRVWAVVRSEAGRLPPALMQLPVVSPGAQVLFFVARAHDGIARREFPSRKPEYLPVSPTRWAQAAADLVDAAKLIAVYPELVICDLVRLRRSVPSLAADGLLGARLGRVIDATSNVDLEDAVLRWEGARGIEPGWTHAMLGKAWLPLRRSLDSMSFDLAYRFEPTPAPEA